MSESNFVLTIENTDADPLVKSPGYLRSLCQKEVSRFEEYVRAEDPQFADGLSRFEKLAIEGYLYQKARGHVDAFHGKDLHHMERKNG
jgi:hypothetical protein